MVAEGPSIYLVHSCIMRELRIAVSGKANCDIIRCCQRGFDSTLVSRHPGPLIQRIVAWRRRAWCSSLPSASCPTHGDGFERYSLYYRGLSEGSFSGNCFVRVSFDSLHRELDHWSQRPMCRSSYLETQPTTFRFYKEHWQNRCFRCVLELIVIERVHC